MMWSAPATDSMLATSLAEIGARLCQTKFSLVTKHTLINGYHHSH